MSSKHPLRTLLEEKGQHVKVEDVQALIDKYPDAVKEKGLNGYLPLHVAIRKGASMEVVQLLINEYPDAAKAKDNHGKLPLHLAVLNDASAEVIQLLVKTYPDAVRETDDDDDVVGKLPLHHAVEKGASVEVIQLLVKAYPDALKEEDDDGKLLLHLAIENNASAETIQLLIMENPDALKEKDDDGNLPLHVAVREGASVEIMQLLIKEYPDALKEKDGEGRLPQNSAASAKVKKVLVKETDALWNSVKNQKRSLAVEYQKLSLQFESALIQHKLALQYYEFRSFYFVFLPVTLIATLITIIGFLISGTTKDDDDDGTAQDRGTADDVNPLLTGHSRQIWSLVVGILGAIATLVNSIGKRTNYQSQSDMHRSAVKALEKICLTVDFENQWFDRNVDDIEYSDSGDNKKLVTTLGADLKTHQASFKAMLDACCDSQVPEQIVQSFTLLDQIFHLQQGGRFSDISHLMFHYHKLWKEYSAYRYWPLKAPSIQVYKKYTEWNNEINAGYHGGDHEGNRNRNVRVLDWLSYGRV